MKPARRTFLQLTTLATGAAAQPPADVKAQTAPKGMAYPRVYSGRQLTMIAFPLGGVGTGSISLGGRGQLRDWEIFNKPDKGKSPAYAFPSIWAKAGNRKPVASVLEAALMPPYEGSSGLGTQNVPGLPRLESASFAGEYPMAKVTFKDSALPVRVSLEAFSPLIPHEHDDSGLPVAVLRYRVTNPAATAASVAISFAIDNPVGEQGRANESRSGSNLEGLLMRNPFLAANAPLAGSFALAVLPGSGGKVTHLRGWKGGSRWRVGPLMYWDDFSSDGELGPEEAVRDTVGSLCLKREIPARGAAEFTFILAWHFPNRTPERLGWRAPKGGEKTLIGNHYCTRFKDAWAAAEYMASNLPRLEKETRAFVDAMRRSTLPGAVKDAAMANLSTYVSNTCFRTADGNFHAWEGANNQAGCCFGNCTHVWNYESTTMHLFPAFSRALREAAFGFCTDDQGLQDFRQMLPPDKERWGFAAADGQMGAIMKLYLDWRLSGDTAWLRKHWPAGKRALEFSWIPNGWDADKDGVMEGCQHNTYDVEFFGPNPLCGVWYLGALRAAEEMARAVGDADAGTYRRLFEQGSKWIDANLFNGEYYIQKVQGVPKDRIAKGLTVGMGGADTEKPDFQAGEGCLVDQLVGQYLACVCGLGDLLDAKNMRTSLQAVMKYNFKRHLKRHESVQRIYALNDEAALVICDYGRGERPRIPFPYHAEAWTGLEYAIAALMMFMGLTSDGLRVVEAVRRRHDGERRNPWDEPECGHHYARALSAWGPVLALSGFSYDAPKQELTAQPKMSPESFECLWASGTGWGSFSQSLTEGRQQFSISVARGTLVCKTMLLAGLATGELPASAAVGSTKFEVRAERKDGDVTVEFSQPLKLEAGQQVVVTL